MQAGHLTWISRKPLALLASCVVTTFAALATAAPRYVVVVVPQPASYERFFLTGVSGGSLAGWAEKTLPPYGWTYPHALLWSYPTSSPVDLNPAGFDYSWATGIASDQQIGYGVRQGGSPTGGPFRALLWSGSATSAVDLHPAGFTHTWGCGASDGRQVGYGSGPATGGDAYNHALLWSSSAASVVDLNPAGFAATKALGITGDQQVGYGVGPATGGAGHYHALLWTGSAASVTDLHPPGFDLTKAFAVGNGQQVGYGTGPATGRAPHALLWSGSAGSVVDLNPPGFTESYAYGVAGGTQVGYGSGPATNGEYHALLWAGSAGSVVDLNDADGRPRPPADAQPWSQATSIDAAGNILGVVSDSANQGVQAVWVPIQEGLTLDAPPTLTARVGQTVRLSTRFTRSADRSPIAGATITFRVDGTVVGAATTDMDGAVTLTYIVAEGQTTGPRQIVVQHNLSPPYGEAIAYGVLNVTKGIPAFSLYAASGWADQTVSLRSLMMCGGQPIGGRIVQFAVDGVVVGQGLSNASGVSVSYTIPASLSPGVHNVTVTFPGNLLYLPASRTTAALTVKPAPKAGVSFSLYPLEGSVGQTVPLRCLMYSGSKPVIGRKVQFAVDGAVVGTGVSDAFGVACPYTIPPGMAAGIHNVTVSFAGDSFHNPASRTTPALTVR